MFDNIIQYLEKTHVSLILLTGLMLLQIESSSCNLVLVLLFRTAFSRHETIL